MTGHCTTGACCTNFVIDLDALTDPDANIEDGDYIRDMLILGEPTDERHRWFRMECRHFDRETRRCREYESRPVMCRRFPYERPCPFEGCTFEDANS